MFSGATSFNGDISGWITGSVTHMDGMFQDAASFDIDISGWITSSETDMNGMFYGTTSFKCEKIYNILSNNLLYNQCKKDKSS